MEDPREDPWQCTASTLLMILSCYLTRMSSSNTDDLNTNVAKVGLRISCEKTKAMLVGEPPTTPISVVSNYSRVLTISSTLAATSPSSLILSKRASEWAWLGKAALVFQRLSVQRQHLVTPLTVPSNFVSTHQSCYPQHCMHVKNGSQWRVSATPQGVFHCRCIRKILGLSWQDRVTNDELMRRSGMEALSKIVQTRRLRLAGHVLRLPDVRPACIAMTWIPESGRRTRGRPQKTWWTLFKEDLHRMNITLHGARRAANDRHRWRNLVAQCPVWDKRN